MIAMRRFWMILPCLVLLAACADAPPPDTGPMQGVRASFPPGAVVNVIRVDALDTLPLRSAELVAPDGSTTPASSIDVQRNPQTIAGQHAFNDPWRTSSLGPNGLNPMPDATSDPSLYAVHQLLLTVSTAEIATPDPVAYRRDWQNYKIRLGFAGGGQTLDMREVPAPKPPAEQTGS
ncbi:MAG TPA: hypothetical protein VNV38_01630 [Stellaceae bacterium]|jgi:hypothetical protein|nr:hypothetical protein [Stellaceae bacterium]